MGNPYDLVMEQLQSYPFNMHPKDVAKFLGVSLTTAYAIIKQDGFPTLDVPGSRLIIVPKISFADWYVNNLKTNPQNHF